MSDFQNYMLAQAEAKAAYQQYNYAGSALNNARIMERLAQIKSQHEPLASLLDTRLSERERLYAAAYFVAIGRMPDFVTEAQKIKP